MSDRYAVIGNPIGHSKSPQIQGMFAEQAAEAFAWWRGVRPDTSAVIRQLTVALL